MSEKTYIVIRGFEVNGQFYNSGRSLTHSEYVSLPPDVKGMVSENEVINFDFKQRDEETPWPRSKNSLKRIDPNKKP